MIKYIAEQFPIESILLEMQDKKINSKRIKEIIEDFFHEIEFSDDFLKKNINSHSAINFFRYICFFKKYSLTRNLFIDADCHEYLTIRINSNSNYFLSLVFNKNGVVDFLSLETGFSDNDGKVKPFHMRGSLETSENFDNAYKIRRLLAMLDNESDFKKSSVTNNIYSSDCIGNTYDNTIEIDKKLKTVFKASKDSTANHRVFLSTEKY